jgi:hypothetical protein
MPQEFFDYQRVSRPADLGTATSVRATSCMLVSLRSTLTPVGCAAHNLQHAVFLWYISPRVGAALAWADGIAQAITG